MGSESIKYDTGSASLSIYIPYREEVQRVDENEKEVTPVIEAPLQKEEVNTNMPGRSLILTNNGEWRETNILNGMSDPRRSNANSVSFICFDSISALTILNFQYNWFNFPKTTSQERQVFPQFHHNSI